MRPCQSTARSPVLAAARGRALPWPQLGSRAWIAGTKPGDDRIQGIGANLDGRTVGRSPPQDRAHASKIRAAHAIARRDWTPTAEMRLRMAPVTRPRTTVMQE